MALFMCKGETLGLVPFSTGSDRQIAAMINGYYDGTYSLNDIKSVWSIGDTRTFNLSAIASATIGSGNDALTTESHRAQTIEMVIIDFNHDTLATATGGKTKALVTLMQKDCLSDGVNYANSNAENGALYPSGYSGSYGSSKRRTWLNSNYYSALPDYIRPLVKQVNKETKGSYSSSSTYDYQEYCWLLSEYELTNSKDYSYGYEGDYYSYFDSDTKRQKEPRASADSVRCSDYWTRSITNSYNNMFVYVDGFGSVGYTYGTYRKGFAPAWCL